MLRHSRRSVLKAAPALAAGGTLLAALPARQGQAASRGLSRLRESESPTPLPELGFTDADGKAFTMADFAGKGVVINLWATWCPPCVAEMPALDRLAMAVAAEGIEVLPLSSDRGGRGVVEAFYNRTGLQKLGVWLDPRGAAARALGARGLPTSIIVDRQGRETARIEGEAAWDGEDFVAAIRRLTGGAAPGERLERT